jgi:hypothetical protein
VAVTSKRFIVRTLFFVSVPSGPRGAERSAFRWPTRLEGAGSEPKPHGRRKRVWEAQLRRAAEGSNRIEEITARDELRDLGTTGGFC